MCVCPHQVVFRVIASRPQSNPNMVLLLQPALHLFQLGVEVMRCDAR